MSSSPEKHFVFFFFSFALYREKVAIFYVKNSTLYEIKEESYFCGWLYWVFSSFSTILFFRIWFKDLWAAVTLISMLFLLLFYFNRCLIYCFFFLLFNFSLIEKKLKVDILFGRWVKGLGSIPGLWSTHPRLDTGWAWVLTFFLVIDPSHLFQMPAGVWISCKIVSPLWLMI